MEGATSEDRRRQAKEERPPGRMKLVKKNVTRNGQGTVKVRTRHLLS